MKQVFQNQKYFYDYSTELRKFIGKYYNKQYTQIEVIYFKFDKDSSVFDDNIDMGSYSKFGKNSGLKWKQYNFLPLFSVNPQQDISYDVSEKGLTYQINLEFVISNAYNIVPGQYDYLYIIDPLDPNFSNKIMFEVTDISQMDMSNFGLWKMSTIQSKYLLTDIVNHISHEYNFISFYNTIIQKEYSYIQMDIMSQLDERYKSLMYDDNIESFVQYVK